MRQIVSIGGGGFSMEAGNPLLDEFVLELTGRQRPRVCFAPSASGDADHYIVRFYRHFSAARCEPSHLSLFRRERAPAAPREHLLAQDLIYVGGGSLTSLIGVWRAHGIDAILREAWESGVVLCGLSAGSLCWFREGVSTFPVRRTESRGSDSCPGATRSTTRASPPAARHSTGGSARAWRRPTPPTTVRRFTSSATTSPRSSPHAVGRAPTGSSFVTAMW
jgi:hypothetical protein